MRTAIATFLLLGMLVSVSAAQDSGQNAIDLTAAKELRRAEAALKAPSGPGTPAIVPYLDAGMTQTMSCTAAGETITVYVTAEYFPEPIASIEFAMWYPAAFTYVDQSSAVGTINGSPDTLTTVTFDPPIDISGQVVVAMVRYATNAGCGTGCVACNTTSFLNNRHRAYSSSGTIYYPAATRSYPCRNGFPDLLAESFTSPASALVYQDISAATSVTARNIGSYSVCQNFFARFYLSADSVITTSDVVIGISTYIGENLSPGQTLVMKPQTPSRIPMTTAPGTYYLGAVVDYRQSISEVSESNNTEYQLITIYPDPTIDTVYCMTEDFQNGSGGWTPLDLTDPGPPKWHQTVYDDGGTMRGVMWCGTDDPAYSTPPGYGNDWVEHLTKSFTLPTGSVSLNYLVQYDGEPDLDKTFIMVSTDGATYAKLDSLVNTSSGFEERSLDLSAYAGMTVSIRFLFKSDISWSDEDGSYDSNGACRLDWVQVTGFAEDNFESGLNGWTAGNLGIVGGEFRLVYEPLCEPGYPCEINGSGKPQITCNAWAAYDPVTGDFPFASPENAALQRGVRIAIQSPAFTIPANALSYFLEFDAYGALPMADQVFYTWYVSSPDGAAWKNENLMYYGTSGWSTKRVDMKAYVGSGATTMRIRLVGHEWFNQTPTPSGSHTCAPIFDNVKVYAVQNLPGNEPGEFPRACAASDGDWDGVGDLTDACPAETASPFDRDGDGCVDEAIGARHVEYLSRDTLAYFINDQGLPYVDDGSDMTAIAAGMGAWSAVPDVNLRVDYEGPTTQRDARALDGINLVTCTDPDYVFPTGVLAVGLTTSYVEQTRFAGVHTRPGEIVDCDLIFNPLMRFRTATQGSGTDLRSVATHEAGHLLGLSHSGVRSSTMFYVLPPGTEASSLEPDDIMVVRRAYADPASLELMSRLKGTVTDGKTGQSVPGAIVFAIDAASGDTLASEYTLLDGSFDISGLPDGSYYVAIYPLNGSSVIAYLQPANINEYVLNHAVTLFVPEYYDAAESQNDDPAAKVAVAVQAGATTNASIITNIDETGPFVTGTSPAAGASGVHIDASMLVAFAEPIELASVAGSFSVREAGSGTAVRGNAALISDDSTIAFIPRDNLSFDTVYELRVGTTLTDKFANPLASPFIMQFTTESKPDVGISSLAPRKGVAGAIVVVSGFGFEENPANLLVDCNGIPAQVREASSTRCVITIPPGATTGNVTVTNLVQGKTSNALAFTVLRAEEVARGYEAGSVDLPSPPRSIDLHPDGATAFVATESGYSAVLVDPGSPNYLAIASFAVPGGLDAVAVTPDGKRAYAVGIDQAKLYRINAETGAGGLADLVILNEMDAGGEPVGIAIDPAGRRAYVANGDAVQVWDINPGSVTFDREIGELSGFGGDLRGKMASDPAGARLLTLDGAGTMHVYDIAGDSLLATIPVGYDPRDVVVDPLGERAYVTDGDGFVTIVSLDLLKRVHDMATGGALRGAGITPAGSFLYAVNRELNIYDVVDLRPNRETYRSVVANMPLPKNPVDGAVAPDGLYAYSLSEAEKKLAVTAIGVGPALSGLWPPAAPVGAKIVLAGSAFEADAEALVSFAGRTVVPEYRGDSVLVAAVPVGAVSGPVCVIGRNPFRVDAPSNEIYFEVLGPTAVNAIRLAAAIPGGADLGEPLAVSAASGIALLASPAAGGPIQLLDVEPTSATFHQFIGAVALDPAYMIDDIVVTPDGSRAFVIDHGAGAPGEPTAIPVIDMNRLSGTFAGVVDSIDVSSLSGGLSGCCVSPAGRSCVLAEYGGGGGARVHLCAIDSESDAVYRIIGTTTVAPGAIEALAYHPAGRYCYCAVSDPDAAAVYVLDADPASGTFMTIVGSAAISIAPPEPALASIAFTPNGSRCLLLTGEIAGGAERRVVMLNAENPASPVVTTVQSVGGAVDGVEHLAVSPRGDRAIVSLQGEGVLHERILLNPDSIVPVSQLDGGSAVSRLFYRSDASCFYGALPAADEVRAYDFAAAHALAAISGDGQSGVVGTSLAAALRVKVTTSGGQGVAGVPVTFAVGDGGGAFAGSGTATQAVATDALGRAEVEWVLGPAVGTQHVAVEAPGLLGSPLEFSATGLTDPGTLPLRLVDVIPAGSTTGASVNTAILVVFSRAVDPASIGATTFFLHENGVATPLSALIGATGGNTVLSLTPRASLRYSTTYRIELAGGIRDDAGGSLENPSSLAFTTGVASPPTLSAISPPSGLRGAQIMLAGTGFDPEMANNTVLFDAAASGVKAAGDDHLGVVVPAEATNLVALVTVHAYGQESNALPFKILTRDSIAIDKDVIANVGTGSSTRSVAITPDGARLYAVSPAANSIISIDIRTRHPYPSIPVGEHPFAIEMHPFGSFAYVTNFLSNTVSVIDIRQGSPQFNEVVETVPVGRNPLDAIVTPDGDRLIVSNVGSNDLTIVDTDEQSGTFNRVLATVATGSSVRSVAVTPDGGLLYVGTNDGYIVVDVVSFAVVASVGTGSTTKSVAVTPDGAFLLLLTSEGAVFVFDIAEGNPTQNQVVGQISTGSSVKSVTVTPDGGLLYLIMESNDAIYVYRLDVDTSAGVRGSVPDEAQTRVRATMVTTLFAGEDPSAMAFAANGSGIAVVTNAGDQTVSIFDPSNRPIAVMVSGLGARQVDRGALITWMTTAEPGVAGYHVLRADGLDAGYRRITEAPVAARGVGASYSFVDESVRPARTYFYKLEVVLQREASKEFGPVEFTYLAQFALRQNAPNPFNPATRIAFTIPEACRVQLFIYDAAGRRIKVLVDRRLQADHYEVLWDGTNNRGTRVASGVYFYRLEAGRHAATRKMVLLR